jgi:Uma2 family endonuclease
MTVTKSLQFKNFEEYLLVPPANRPEGRFEYWDGELVPVMSESLFNDVIANYLYFLLIQAGIYHELVHPGRVEIVVPGKPRTRYPDLTVLDEIHLTLMQESSRLTQDMPPPPLVVEVVSPGDERSENYRRDYEAKPGQYAERGIPELWLIDPDRAVVLVGKLTGDAYQFESFQDDMLIISPTFPELRLTAQQVLKAGK